MQKIVAGQDWNRNLQFTYVWRSYKCQFAVTFPYLVVTKTSVQVPRSNFTVYMLPHQPALPAGYDPETTDEPLQKSF